MFMRPTKCEMAPQGRNQYRNVCWRCHLVVTASHNGCCQGCHWLRCVCGACYCNAPPEFQARYAKKRKTKSTCSRCRHLPG